TSAITSSHDHTDTKQSRIYNKCTEEPSRTVTVNRLPRFQVKLKGNDPVTSKGKNQTTKKRMLSSSTKEHNKSQEIGISNREIVSYNKCSTSCQTKNKGINKIEKQYNKNQGMECLFKNIRKSSRTTKVVGKTVEQLERSILNNKHPISSNIYRCISNRLGYKSRGTIDKWSLDQCREEVTHQCSGNESNTVCID
ncbi:38888_t:CDS:1, partial [Gigaspora margarita]